MTEDVIEKYETFNTRGCSEDLIFGGFNDHPIPSAYSDLTHDYDDDGTQIEAALMDNEGVVYAFVPNDKKTMTTALIQTLTPHQTIFWKLKEGIEWAMKLKKGKLKEWNLKLK